MTRLTVALAAVLFLLPCVASAADTCHVVMDGQTVTNYYESVAEAVWAIGTGTGVITMIADDVITATNPAQRVDVDGHVTIVSDGGDRTITRGATGAYTNYSMLYVGRVNLNTNAVLTLGAPGMTGTLTFDGGSFLNFGSCIILCYRGTLNIHDGVVLKNNITEYGGGAVYNEGVFNLFGGLLVSNLSYGTGGAVQNAGYYGSPAVFNMYGGTIAHNRSLNGINGWGGYGGAVANEGAATFNMYGGLIYGNEAEFAGGGVHNTKDSQSGTETATFNMSGGTISGNSVLDENGLGAGVYNDDVMTMEGDALITDDNEVYLDEAVITVTGELTAPGPAATIAPGSIAPETPLIVVAGGAGVTLEEALGSFALGSGSGDELVVDPESGAIILATPFQAWVLRRGHSLSDPDFGAEADVDEDTMSTWQEFLADTDPADSNSVLRIAACAVAPDQTIALAASTNRVYSLYFKPTLEDTNWVSVVTSVPGTNTSISLADTNVRERAYYSVGAKPPP